MLLNDYLSESTNKRRILIVSDLERGQALIRMYEAKTHSIVKNVRCMTMAQIAETIYQYTQSQKGYENEYEFLDGIEAMVLFRRVLIKCLNELRYFNNENIMNLATSREIYRKINLIRANGWSGQEKEDNNDRILDLKKLQSAYEDELVNEKLHDQIEREKYVLKAINEWGDKKVELDCIFASELTVLVEDARYINGVEEKLLAQLGCNDSSNVSVFGDDSSLDSLDNCKGRSYFYKGYGSFNEASFIANDIFENNYPLGSVTVLYNSEKQLPSIEAALRGNGIRMSIISGHSAQSNPIINVVKRIIEWARNDYSERALEKILVNPAMCVRVEIDGEMKNPLAGRGYYDHILNPRNRWGDRIVLGWGYDRNRVFIEHEKKYIEESEKNASVSEILKMHEKLLDIFGENGKKYDDANKVSPIVIYDKLLEFLKEYTNKNAENVLGIEKIKRLKGAVSLEKRDLPLNETLQLFEDLIDGIDISDDIRSDAVVVQSVTDWTVLERPHVYMIGLALKDLQNGIAESPVMFDGEMERYLEKGYVPTLKNQSDRKERNLYCTLKTFCGNRIVFGYSDYDTVGFCENNASSFFRGVMGSVDCKDTNELPEFVYGNPIGNAGSEELVEWQERESFDISITSSSSMEALLECPKKFAYDRTLSIPDSEFVDKDFGGWLDAGHRGTFFHGVVEKYCDEKLLISSRDEYDYLIDEELLERIATDIETEMLSEVPCTIRGLADRETTNIIDFARDYLQGLIADLNSEPCWRVLKTEQRFAKSIFSVKSYDGVNYSFELTGYIDRIDYRIDKEQKTCFIRLIDYKTGKREKKDNENYLGKLMQYLIYGKAVMETGKVNDEKKDEILVIDMVKDLIAERENDKDIRSYKFELENFQYVFPMDMTTRESIVIPADDFENNNMVRLKSVLTIIGNKHVYPDHKELIDVLADISSEYPDNSEEINSFRDLLVDNPKIENDKCQYCAYDCLCMNRKAGEIK